MVILSWRISWITTSRSVMFPRSTSGRAPSISSSIRFWMRAVSLKRPPTLFTISSLLRASIILLDTSRTLVLDDPDDLLDRLVHHVVDHEEVERMRALGHVDLALRGAEALEDVFLALAAAVRQALQKRRRVGRENEDQQGVG